MDDQYAQLIDDNRRRFYTSMAIECPECIDELEEIPMPEQSSNNIPAHDHAVPQHVTDQLKRHEMYIDQLQGENARMFGNIETSLEYTKREIHTIQSTWKEVSARLEEHGRKLDAYNNLRERIDVIEQTHDQLAKDFIPRGEFNGAVGSLRDQLRSNFATMQWVLGGILAFATGIGGYLIFGA